jgi:hypothetical protein
MLFSMGQNDDEIQYLTFSEFKKEFPKAARIWNWTPRMFYYFSEGGLLNRRFNHSIKSHTYDKKSLLILIGVINDGLDDRRIQL